MTVAPRLHVRGLSKTFGTTQVLHDAELTVFPGEVHGLAGQNGSGKSTVIKLLTGVHAPDPGAEYRVDGAIMRLPVRWPDVHAAGVSVVHQDLGLLDALSVAENICVGGFPTAYGRIDRRRRDALAQRTLARLGVELDPIALVETLTAAQRAEVAIARAMRDQTDGSGLIILDESTRALTGEDLERVHAMLRRLAAAGSSAVVISHNLGELMSVTDRLTILRDGYVVGSGLPTAELDEQEIARRMLGGTVDTVTPRPRAQPAVSHPDEVMTVSGLAGDGLRSVSFAAERGEVLGIIGVPGSGYEQLPYLLSGAKRASAGILRTPTGALDLSRSSIAACIRLGVVLVPERRDRDGLAFELSVRDNISLPALRHRGRPWFVSRRWQDAEAERAAERLDIRPRTPSLLVKQLSGGNQQKVLLAKWLHLGPSVMILHEPTQAVDVGARQDILRALQSAAESGVAVVIVSSEAEDLSAACDRVLIHTHGGELKHAETDTDIPLLEQVYAYTESAVRSAA
jgi:ribose transport system ATP-binding protein